MSWLGTILSKSSDPEESSPNRTGQENLDSELLSRFFEGDDTALVQLFDRHNHRLYLYCHQYLNDSEQAEDVTQEVWERIMKMRRTSTERTIRNVPGLLFTMTRNLCIDSIRTRRHHADLEEIPESKHPTSSIPELSHLEELVILALPHLPAHQREVLALNAYSGYQFEEIAEMLGEPVGTIRTRAWRARTHLGRIIGAMIGLEEDKLKPRRSEESGGAQ
ncbi:MAG: RNA polymerase sigma factor [Bacteroidetes bacterium]|nr:RNA polymerase sigma factor [Bacteroidota bacterium]